MANRDREMEQHVRTWNGFVRLIVYSTAIVVLVLVLMALLLL